MIYFLAGFAFGVLQLFLLKKVAVDGIMSAKPLKAILPFIAIKLVCYAIGVFVCLTIWRDNIIPVGIGLGVGMIVSAFTAYIYMTANKQ